MNPGSIDTVKIFHFIAYAGQNEMAVNISVAMARLVSSSGSVERT